MFILTIIIQIHSHLACIPCTVSSAQCSLKYARAHNRRPHHTMSPKFNGIYVHSTHTKTSLYMFIHIVSNIYPSLTCVQHALSLLHLHASFNVVSFWSRKLDIQDHNDTILKDACKWHARFHLPNCIHEVDLFLYNELNTFTTNRIHLHVSIVILSVVVVSSLCML